MNAAEQIPSQAPPQVGIPQVPPAPVARDPRAKSVPLACLLSAMPGLGQVYVGYYQRGFVHAIVVAVIITLLATGDMDSLTPLLGLFLPFFWLYNVIDAGRRAALYNQALIGSESIELPQDFQMPGVRGSIWGGLLLIAGGAILLSNTLYGISLAWVEDWWPVAPILMGVYLLARGVMDRASAEG